ncbi:antichymotrypsin-2-like isoform X2 [Cataglyphis hispanica]|uniref:antichymotrypsin-2-like isoform X2 n=1 Tax=Cataglyphis hispanica TaxID=1086592 RepID=UPI00217FEC14|nr:antichymotrypsin-2-like isoform X2 [Cataglyphis hispanica]
MFKSTALFVIIIASTVLNILAMSFEDISSITKSNTFKQISTACNDFTNSLYKTLAVSADKNIIISPFSLHMILSLLSNGAGGSTLDELRSALGYNNKDNDKESLNDEFKALIVLLNDMENVTLNIANAAYIQKEVDLMGDFLSICMNIFQSAISKINFKNNVHAAETINLWVQMATHNKISDIISPDDISIDTNFILVNAIYFKSRWLKPFKEEDTQLREFHISKTEICLVPTMYKKATYSYGEVPAWNTQFIEIPYLNEKIVMIILLPDKEVELQVIENNFNWETLVKTHRFRDDFELYLPKFKFEIAINLKDILNKIGLNSMFKDNCDFSRLSQFPLKVNNVLQKIFIDVNEQGAEAAAVTAVEMRLKRMAIEPMEFIVDRPFMFAIEHKPTRIPLFLGSVRKLNASNSPISVKDGTNIKDEL